MDDRKRLEDLQRRPEEEWVDADGNHIEDHDRGLLYDVGTLLSRRRALGLFGGMGALAALAACTTDSGSGTAAWTGTSAGTSTSGSTSSGTGSTSSGTGSTGSVGTTTATDDSAAGSLDEIPDETGGPYPGDGSNGPNVLDDAGIVRSDIRSSFGSSTTTAEGVPLTFSFTVRDASTGAAMAGSAVYAWHCDREGHYSMYSEAAQDENYLRGVQEADSTGTVTFTSIFPACYSGRWPHIHFEVYQDASDAMSSGTVVKTSQLALPKEACEAVYATSGYESSGQNLSQVSLAGDNVFGNDGGIHQLATMSGDASSGYTATLTVGV